MSFHVYTAADGQHYRHDDDPCSVTLLDSAMQPLGTSVTPDEEEYDAVASLRGGSLC